MEKEDRSNQFVDELEMERVNDNFGLLIQNYRKMKGYSLKQLEETTKISAAYINRIERGERKEVSFAKVIRLADALKIPYSVLIANSFCGINVHELVVDRDTKEKIIDIMEYIIYSKWNNESKIHDLYQISQKIDGLKLR